MNFASRSHYTHLLQEGIDIYEYQPTMLHAKVMIVDGVWSMFGSANFDNRSLEMNDELNVAVSDPAPCHALPGGLRAGPAGLEAHRSGHVARRFEARASSRGDR